VSDGLKWQYMYIVNCHVYIYLLTYSTSAEEVAVANHDLSTDHTINFTLMTTM